MTARERNQKGECNRLLGHLKFSRFHDLAIGIGKVIDVNTAGKFIEVEYGALLGEGDGKNLFTQDTTVQLQRKPPFKIIAQFKGDVADGRVWVQPYHSGGRLLHRRGGLLRKGAQRSQQEKRYDGYEFQVSKYKARFELFQIEMG